jgi:putative transposase
MQMPRSRRHAPVGFALHVGNRATDNRQLFFEATDYQRFIDLLMEARECHRVRMHAYGVMPNHFHIIMVAISDGAVSACIQRLTGRHSCQVRKDTATQGRGHVYQGRFWSEVILSNVDYLRVLHYVEANPLKAKLVRRAEDWQWSSLWERETGGRVLLDPSPVALPADWVDIVNKPIVSA